MAGMLAPSAADCAVGPAFPGVADVVERITNLGYEWRNSDGN
ncbi:MAG TPA: hypothetical protein VLM79_02550 [Kofleriaceae bacterium]|nr:hypothetical protein [Kofleriaceae bacterium]